MVSIDSLMARYNLLLQTYLPIPIQFKAPASTQAIARAERMLGIRFQPDMLTMIKTVNGYDLTTDALPRVHDIPALLPVESMPIVRDDFREILEDLGTADVWDDLYIPFAKYPGINKYLFLDYRNGTENIPVVVVDDDTGIPEPFADSYNDAVDILLKRITDTKNPGSVHREGPMEIEPEPTVIRKVNPAMEARRDKGPKEKSIRGVFDYHMNNLVINTRLIKRLLKFVSAYETRSEEHIAFLGGNLLGINKINYFGEDEQTWRDEILNIPNCEALEDDFHNLPDVNPDFFVTGSLLNMTHVYLAHRIMISGLSDREKELGLTAVFKMLHYKFVASLLYRNFKHRTQEAVALALYESLSRKNLLKKYHSFGAMLEARSKDVFSKKSIHYNTLMKMAPDKACLYVVSDIQTRIRSVFNNLTSEYMRLKEMGSRIGENSPFIMTEDGKELKDVINDVETLQRNMETVLTDPHDFIRDEVLEYTLKIIPTAEERYLKKALLYISEHSDDRKSDSVYQMLRYMVMYLNRILKQVRGADATTPAIVAKTRNLARSSQLGDKDLLAVRDYVTDMLDQSLSGKSSKVIASTRIAVIVYLTIRILAYKHYNR